MAIGRQMDPEEMARVHSGLYWAIKTNDLLPFATPWVDLEGIRLSDISQTEKEKYRVISLIRGI